MKSFVRIFVEISLKILVFDQFLARFGRIGYFRVFLVVFEDCFPK